MAAEGIKGNLVSVSWLQQILNSSDILVVDASPAQLHKAQHIPGAINVDLFSYGGQELPVSEMEQRFQSFGISRGGPCSAESSVWTECVKTAYGTLRYCACSVSMRELCRLVNWNMQ